MTSSVSAALEAEREEPGRESLSPPATPIARRLSIVIPGLEAYGWTSFHGFTTYWMIKKASSCTVYCVENMADHKKMVWVSVQCRQKLANHQKSRCHSGAVLRNLMLLLPAALKTGSAGLSIMEGSSWLILMKTSFILINEAPLGESRDTLFILQQLAFEL